MSKPLLLLSNDDGYRARGIQLLFEGLSTQYEVVMVAPAHDQSATSHALSLHRPLRHEIHSPQVHSIDGTPADCVYVGLFHPNILPRWPDVVVSGLNHGPNLAGDVHYSGTVAAAREGALRQIPAVAFSAANQEVMAGSISIALAIVERLLSTVEQARSLAASGAENTSGGELTPFLNVNFPAKAPQGVRATRLGIREYQDEIWIRSDPRGREYLWLGGPGPQPHPPLEGSDTQASDEGFVSVTPLRTAVTQPEGLGIAAAVAAWAERKAMAKE